MNTQKTFQVVIAWLVSSIKEDYTGRRTKVMTPYAAMWESQGTNEGIIKAQNHAESMKKDCERVEVFTFSIEEENLRESS